MSVQRTFTLIPPIANARGDSPERQRQHARPMTSKQVRKAYKASTRNPPMSRAERLKQEKAELERIRKEFEREKAAAKARLAREKKKEKELAEREQKKKKGMPLVSVRPSQDTIARFVRGNGSGKKRCCAGQALEERKGNDELRGKLEEVAPRISPLLAKSSGKKELDLIPEEDESELEELLNSITEPRFESEPQQHRLQNDADGAVGAVGAKSPTKSIPQAQDIMLPPARPSFVSRQPQPLKTPPKLQESPQKKVISEPSPPFIPQPPPMSTQAILGNLDDFFPSSSQQDRELQEATPPPRPPKTTNSNINEPTDNLPPTPHHFFTPSGSNELVSLAFQQSRHTAVLQGIQEQELPQTYPLNDTWTLRPSLPNPNTIDAPSKDTNSPTKPNIPKADATEDKEYLRPEMPYSISDSQETEYGGEWVDELASDIII